MGYMHLDNLYKNQTILLFKEAYALEKIHGTSAHVTWDGAMLNFFSGGESYEKFKSLFDIIGLTGRFMDFGYATRKVVIYGEAYGGKCQGMADTYGPNLKFIAFDVLLDETNWLNVPQAEDFCKTLNIEFVPWVKISTNLAELDAHRDAPSVQAVRNGITEPKVREGIVLRPLIDMVTSTGNRVMCKHKGDKFRETASPRVVDDPSKLQILADADKITNEWVVMHRLEHVLDKIPKHGMEKMRDIILAMTEDVFREGKGEIVESELVKKAISKKTVELYKNYLKSKMVTNA